MTYKPPDSGGSSPFARPIFFTSWIPSFREIDTSLNALNTLAEISVTVVGIRAVVVDHRRQYVAEYGRLAAAVARLGPDPLGVPFRHARCQSFYAEPARTAAV